MTARVCEAGHHGTAVFLGERREGSGRDRVAGDARGRGDRGARFGAGREDYGAEEETERSALRRAVFESSSHLGLGKGVIVQTRQHEIGRRSSSS